jgi:site-specific DNA-cytosine methylase
MLTVLDLFCGMGGWSEPFIEDRDEVWGIDIKDYGYRGKLIQEDIRNLDGYSFTDMDLIIGSPPCNEFSIARSWDLAWPGRKERDPEAGLKLVAEFQRFVKEAQPRFWAWENVDNIKKWYAEKPIWKFFISRGGRRRLFGNIPIPLAPDYRFQRSFGSTPEERKRYGMSRRLLHQERARIPYSIARFVADAVKAQYR